jgi:hypothetical protein
MMPIPAAAAAEFLKNSLRVVLFSVGLMLFLLLERILNISSSDWKKFRTGEPPLRTIGSTTMKNEQFLIAPCGQSEWTKANADILLLYLFGPGSVASSFMQNLSSPTENPAPREMDR